MRQHSYKYVCVTTSQFDAKAFVRQSHWNRPILYCRANGYSRCVLESKYSLLFHDILVSIPINCFVRSANIATQCAKNCGFNELHYSV